MAADGRPVLSLDLPEGKLVAQSQLQAGKNGNRDWVNDYRSTKIQLGFDGRGKDLIAIERIRFHCSNAVPLIALSGGKDSTVLRDLAQRADIPIEPYFSFTTVDPPEVVHFIKKEWTEVVILRPEITMWQLVEKKGMLPLRQRRFCCEALKENIGSGRIVVTGIRSEESSSRSNRHLFEICRNDPSKMFLNPILDWTTTEVWGYIRQHKLPYCSLYDEGFKRIGCVLCPMSSNAKIELIRWPKIALAYRHTLERIFPKIILRHEGKQTFKSPDQYWNWWLNRNAHALKEEQCLMHFE